MSDEEELERLKTIRIIRGFRPAERKRYEQLLKKQSMKLIKVNQKGWDKHKDEPFTI